MTHMSEREARGAGGWGWRRGSCLSSSKVYFYFLFSHLTTCNYCLQTLLDYLGVLAGFPLLFLGKKSFLKVTQAKLFATRAQQNVTIQCPAVFALFQAVR